MKEETLANIAKDIKKKESLVLLVNYTGEEVDETLTRLSNQNVFLFDFNKGSKTIIKALLSSANEEELSFVIEELILNNAIPSHEDRALHEYLLVFKSVERCFLSNEEVDDVLRFLENLAKTKFRVLLVGNTTIPFLSYLEPMIERKKITVCQKGLFTFSDYLKENEGINFLKQCKRSKNGQKIIQKDFYRYLFSGGIIPFEKSLSLKESQGKIKDISFNEINNLKNSFVEKKDKEIIEAIYKSVPYELANSNRRFQKSHLKIKNAKNLSLDPYIERLKESGYAIVTPNLKELEPPLLDKNQIGESKIYYPNIAYLFHTLLTKEERLLALNDIVLSGGLYENAVATELSKNHKENLYYYSDKKQGRIDFVFEHNGLLYFVMVEAGKTKKEIKLNRLLLKRLLKSNSNIGSVLILTKDSFRKIDSKILEIPIYMLFELD